VLPGWPLALPSRSTSNAAILIGLLAGYALAFAFGMVNFGAVAKASWITAIQPLPYGFEFSLGAVIAVTLVSIVSAIETVGDCSATTKAGAGRVATDKEIAGATYADGLGTAVAGVFGGLPNTSFSQNVGIVGMTGVMSRHVVTVAGIIMIVCGLIPKIGAIIASMPLPVLGGAGRVEDADDLGGGAHGSDRDCAEPGPAKRRLMRL